MIEGKNLRCQIYCQKGKRIEADIPADTGIYEKEGIYIELIEEMTDGCQCGKIRLKMKNEACKENDNLRMERPVRIYIPMEERPEKITAMYMYNEWWTRPAFVDGFWEIPECTQIAFLKYKNHFSCLIPMVGREFKTYITKGTDTELCMEMTSYLGGQRELEEPLYLTAEAPVLEEAVHKAFLWLAEYKGIRMRKERRIPEMLQYLGWCSWDACYKEVSEEKIRQKADELIEKKVPIKWMLIDDGWLSTKDDLIYSYEPDKEKFPNGFKGMIKEIKEKGNIRWFGVWHALGGYWGGILPGSSLDSKKRSYLYRTVNGKLLPSPYTGERFYRDWYKKLRQEEIDFVKVDGQSSVPYYFENSLPVSEAARGMNQALESGASYMDGAIINCMGMAMENILARPASAVSRNSDDFVPDKENSFAEHLLQNAYNAVYHNELYCCDWDMFWTKHKDCVKHSLLRAVSGGPVYFSDKIGDTKPEVLKPLAYLDGRILMMERSAKPTADCLFTDPMKSGVLKLTNVAAYGQEKKGGGIVVYNLTGQRQKYTFSPMDIQDIGLSEKYWVYNYFCQTAKICGSGEVITEELDENQFAWYQILSCDGAGTFLGLKDKYAGFIAVESMYMTERGMTAVIHEQGVLGFLSLKEPKRVLCNGIDVSENLERKGLLYMVDLEEKDNKVIMEVVWN